MAERHVRQTAELESIQHAQRTAQLYLERDAQSQLLARASKALYRAIIFLRSKPKGIDSPLYVDLVETMQAIDERAPAPLCTRCADSQASSERVLGECAEAEARWTNLCEAHAAFKVEMVSQMRRRASFGDTSASLKRLLETWADVLEGKGSTSWAQMNRADLEWESERTT